MLAMGLMRFIMSVAPLEGEWIFFTKGAVVRGRQ